MAAKKMKIGGGFKAGEPAHSFGLFAVKNALDNKECFSENINVKVIHIVIIILL